MSVRLPFKQFKHKNTLKKILFIGSVDPYSEEENRLRPLWPAYLAAYAEDKLGAGKLDYRFATTKIGREIENFRPDVVAISSVTKNYGYAAEHARVAKQYGLPVIVGGIHITTLPQTLTDDMDIGCIGEGEQTFYELIRLYLETGRFSPNGLSKIDGIVYHDNGRLVRTPARTLLKSLDELPHPKRALIGYGRRGYVYTARGCLYKCVFCSCTHFWGGVRYLSPHRVLEEVEELIRHGVKVIRINDENFASNKRRLKAISDLIVNKGLHRKARFSCWCRANNVSHEVVDALKAMNIVSVKMGLESGCDRTLKYLKGGVTVRDNRNAINMLKDAGIQVNGDFIIGAPEETLEEIMETYNLIKNSRLDFIDVGILTPLPGTPVWDYAVEKKIVSDNMDWRRLNFKFQHNLDDALILSETLTRQQLYRLFRNFQRLRAIKAVKAVPHTPWLNELSALILKRTGGKISRAVARASNKFSARLE